MMCASGNRIFSCFFRMPHKMSCRSVSQHYISSISFTTIVDAEICHIATHFLKYFQISIQDASSMKMYTKNESLKFQALVKISSFSSL